MLPPPYTAHAYKINMTRRLNQFALDPCSIISNIIYIILRYKELKTYLQVTFCLKWHVWFTMVPFEPLSKKTE